MKSRHTLALIEENYSGDINVVEYLKDVPSKFKLKELISQLDIKPIQLVRKGEDIYKEKFKSGEYSDEEWINILHENPKLIERPIVSLDGNAVIGRPPENVFDLI